MQQFCLLNINQELQVAEDWYQVAHTKEQGKLTVVYSNHCRDLYGHEISISRQCQLQGKCKLV